MSQPIRTDSSPMLEPDSPVGPSERQIHLEHLAALDATVFRGAGGAEPELVLELEAGKLRLRSSECGAPSRGG